MKTLTYTAKTPDRAGFYWHVRPDEDETIVRIFKDAQGYWSVQYDNLQIEARPQEFDIAAGVDYLENYRGGQWCYIPRPMSPEWPEIEVFD